MSVGGSYILIGRGLQCGLVIALSLHYVGDTVEWRVRYRYSLPREGGTELEYRLIEHKKLWKHLPEQTSNLHSSFHPRLSGTPGSIVENYS